jgi:hypothetical protein
MQTKKLFHQFPIQSQLLLVLAMVYWLQACTIDKRGAGTPDRVVEQYLLALENKDENSILQLVPEKSNFTKEAKAKIDKLGGQKITDRKIFYNKPKPVLWKAKINGVAVDRNGAKKKFEDLIVLEYQSKGELKLYAGRWYLLLEDR